jgi:ribonuclease D
LLKVDFASFLEQDLAANRVSGAVDYSLIQSDKQLPELFAALADSDLLGVDTEFISEDCYRPELCLLQISTRKQVYLVDPIAVERLGEVWDYLMHSDQVIVVHAGREEILFAYRATGKAYDQLFDVQLALGMLGGEYPASYGKVLQRMLGLSASKGETRTDWRKRPLTGAQMEYAALDVLHLPRLHDLLQQQLAEAGRLSWLKDELQQRQANLVEYERAEGWSRLPGVQGLVGQQLAVVRELWMWRDQRALRKNMPSRRVLRDDLLVELARRGSADPRKISHVRGLHHAGLQRFLPEISACITKGMKSEPPCAPWFYSQRRPRPPALLQQFLSAAMGYLCRSHQISPAIVGTSDDVGQLASYWLADSKLPDDDPGLPNLLKGWRGELIGQPLYEIYCGRKTLRVNQPSDEMPLALCEVPQDS